MLFSGPDLFSSQTKIRLLYYCT